MARIGTATVILRLDEPLAAAVGIGETIHLSDGTDVTLTEVSEDKRSLTVQGGVELGWEPATSYIVGWERPNVYDERGQFIGSTDRVAHALLDGDPVCNRSKLNKSREGWTIVPSQPVIAWREAGGPDEGKPVPRCLDCLTRTDWPGRWKDSDWTLRSQIPSY
ncbi:MAG: hypothetical protein M0004_09905 [Actinomycetota bacterium]|nr:hypothetical protein [Actinomycetota bacterium]